MMQTWAILRESYLQVNSKRLFWIAMAISGVIVLVFAAVGIDEEGLTLLWWRLPFPISTAFLSEGVFYKLMFFNLGVKFWLGWGATILALVTTAGVFPEFMTSGAIDVTLAKPLSRLRLFLTKYLAAMAFVAMQVGVFAVASFLVIGLRGKDWEPSVLLTIPLMMLFFSYLFSVCVLIGVVTRSTVAALLLTMVVWLGFFSMHATESILLFVRTQGEQNVAWLEGDIAEREAAIADQAEGAETGGVVNALKGAFNAPRRESELAQRREQLEDARASLGTTARWHSAFLVVKTVLPKTAETLDLQERWMLDMADLPEYATPEEEAPVRMRSPGDDDLPVPENPEATQRAVIEKARSRPLWWIIGTSLGFETVVLGLAAWAFCRRDY